MRAWPILLGILVGLIALLYGRELGVDDIDGWRRATRYTARAGLVLFLITYSASSLARLTHGRLVLMVLRDRRWWGLGYAACMMVHAYAFLTLFDTGTAQLPLVVAVGGGAGYALIAAMALTSNRRAMRRLGPAWRHLHQVGIHGLWLIYTVIFAARVIRPGSFIIGLYGLALTLGALALRLAARRRPQLPADIA